MNSVKRKIPKSSVLGTVCNRKAKKETFAKKIHGFSTKAW
jgi:hypothetical protein